MFYCRAEGSKEKSLEIAKRMLSMGFDTKTICKATGLAKEEFEG